MPQPMGRESRRIPTRWRSRKANRHRHRRSRTPQRRLLCSRKKAARRSYWVDGSWALCPILLLQSGKAAEKRWSTKDTADPAEDRTGGRMLVNTGKTLVLVSLLLWALGCPVRATPAVAARSCPHSRRRPDDGRHSYAEPWFGHCSLPPLRESRTIPCHRTPNRRLRLLPQIQHVIRLTSCRWALRGPQVRLRCGLQYTNFE